MAEMSRKRKLCCGLSACCNRSESQDALQKLAKKTNDKEMTFKEKLSNCACWPFRICKRQKVADGKGGKKPMMMDEKPSFWKRICCCSSCCRSDEQNNMKGSGMKVSFEVERMFALPSIVLARKINIKIKTKMQYFLVQMNDLIKMNCCINFIMVIFMILF
jgi:hypothetical protein